MFVRHRVADFDAWKAVYDLFGDERSALGVTADAVFQLASDPNDVTLWHDFDTLEAAQDLASSLLLREAMTRAGVANEPSLWFTTPA